MAGVWAEQGASPTQIRDRATEPINHSFDILEHGLAAWLKRTSRAARSNRGERPLEWETRSFGRAEVGGGPARGADVAVLQGQERLRQRGQDPFRGQLVWFQGLGGRV